MNMNTGKVLGLKPLISYPLLTAGFLLILAVFINLPLFDESPDPALQAALAPIPMPQARDNAWIALWGFNAEADREMTPAGQGIIERHDERVRENLAHTLEAADYMEFLGNQGNDSAEDWLQGYESCTPRSEQGCLAATIAQLGNLGSSTRLNLLIRRWERIIVLPSYTEQQMDSPEDALPNYGLLMRTSDIALARLAGTDPAQFLGRLEQDSDFWRRVLNGNSSLVSKMVSVAMLWRDAQYLSDYLLDTPASSTILTTAARIARPLTPEELDISEVWHYEMRIGMQSVNRWQNSWLQSLFMQEQATDNTAFNYTWQPLMQLSQLSPGELYVYTSEQQANGRLPMQCCSSSANISLLSPAFLYNPAGKLLLASDHDHGESNLEDYMERVFDLEGYLRLVYIQLAMLETDSGSPLPLLGQERFANPHTGAPMDWDASSRQLFFECRGLGNRCAISLESSQ